MLGDYSFEILIPECSTTLEVIRTQSDKHFEARETNSVLLFGMRPSQGIQPIFSGWQKIEFLRSSPTSTDCDPLYVPGSPGADRQARPLHRIKMHSSAARLRCLVSPHAGWFRRLRRPQISYPRPLPNSRNADCSNP